MKKAKLNHIRFRQKIVAAALITGTFAVTGLSQQLATTKTAQADEIPPLRCEAHSSCLDRITECHPIVVEYLDKPYVYSQFKRVLKNDTVCIAYNGTKTNYTQQSEPASFISHAYEYSPAGPRTQPRAIALAQNECEALRSTEIEAYRECN